MEQIKIPDGYHSDLNLHDTQVAIKTVKDFFQQTLSQKLNLLRVSAPIFVSPSSGLNDNLNGVERPVSFDIKGQDENAEIVHSLAKWKRYALKKYGFAHGEGLYTDMVAIRRDEDLDNIHSVYVDQWDWEAVIKKEQRELATLKAVVRKIYNAMKETQRIVCSKFDGLENNFADEITFVTTQELEDLYPDDEPKERENKFLRKHGAACIMQIGKVLESGMRHDGRAPDYDDWELNADIVVYYPLLDCAFELSSMGIRVDENSLVSQVNEAGCSERLELDFHKMILEKKLPYTIGGGIGQSRLCMYMLNKAHIGEVQQSVWPDDMIKTCKDANINLM